MDNEQFSQEFAHLNNSILNMDDDIYEFHKMVSTDEIDNIIGEQTDFFKNGDKDQEICKDNLFDKEIKKNQKKIDSEVDNLINYIK